MSCACDNDYPSCFTEKVRRARKRHFCCECGDEISPGSAYQYASGVWDGQGPGAFKTCAPCAAWRSVLQAHPDGCPCVCFGELWGEIAEFTREVLEYDDETGQECFRPWRPAPIELRIDA